MRRCSSRALPARSVLRTGWKIMEMEVTNLLLCNNIQEIVRLLSLYSVSEVDRKAFVKTLLTSNVFDIEEVPLAGKKTEKKILDVYMLALGLALQRSEVGEEKESEKEKEKK